MFGFQKKKSKKKETIDINVGMIEDGTIIKSTQAAVGKYAKPSAYARNLYDIGEAHRAAKDAVFSKGDIVRDPYDGNVLYQRKAEAKLNHGQDYSKHYAEADHIDSIKNIHERHKNDPFLTNADIRDVANQPDNFQVISATNNRSKGRKSQSEWMMDISDADMRSYGIKLGKEAQVRNDFRLFVDSVENAVGTAHRAGKDSAQDVGKTAATISGIYNIIDCINGKKTFSDALMDTGDDALKYGAQAYVKGAGLTVLNNTLCSRESAFLQTLGKNNVVGKVITTATVAGDTVVKWGNGEISTETCLLELGDKGCNFAGSHYGTIIGQSVIPIPVVGGAIGGLIGGTLCSSVYNNLVEPIREEQRRKEAEIRAIVLEMFAERRRQLAEKRRQEDVRNALQANTSRGVLKGIFLILANGEFQDLCNQANFYVSNHVETRYRIAESIYLSLQIQEYRRQLREYADSFFKGYAECFDSAFNVIDSSLDIGDYDGAIQGTNQISRTMNKQPLIENTNDFKKLIFGKGSIRL